MGIYSYIASIYSDMYILIHLILYSFVDFTFSIACNGSTTVSDGLTEPVMLQYRSSEDWDHWISIDSGKHLL